MVMTVPSSSKYPWCTRVRRRGHVDVSIYEMREWRGRSMCISTYSADVNTELKESWGVRDKERQRETDTQTHRDRGRVPCVCVCERESERERKKLSAIVKLAGGCRHSAFAVHAWTAAIKFLAGHRRVLVIPIERNGSTEICVDCQ